MVAKKVIAWLVRVLFAVFSVFPQQRTVAFLSRQSSRPFDFTLLEPALQERLGGYTFTWACVSKGGKLGVGLFLRQLYLVATSALCLVDGYVPAVSIPRAHRSVCVQLWHASGAVKKFGYQCLDTPAGRSSVDAYAFRMHKGYDYIIAGMQGAVPAFAEGFGANPSIILPLGLPHLDYLLAERETGLGDAMLLPLLPGQQGEPSPCVVLYAPTFRKGNANPNWLDENVAALQEAFAGLNVVLVVAGHPLDASIWKNAKSITPEQVSQAAQPAYAIQGGQSTRSVDVSATPHVSALQLQGSTIKALHAADVVISDYSAVALDAGAMGKPVFFYVPDIEEYRQSPGLNVDPLALFPDVAFTSAQNLAQAVLGADKDHAGNTDVSSTYAVANTAAAATLAAPASSFRAFIESYAANVDGDSIPAIANFLISELNRSF